ncbi:hypothetical protein quinque_013450 [Culex quinquefasciatus]
MTSQRDFLRSMNEDGDGGGGDDDDDDSDTLTELSFSRSPTSSLGRSSTGSIPWAEDAVKQNQLEWERIERMFYGEEDLPQDNKLREEFLEWITAFPHLRVLGSAMTIQENQAAKSSDPFHEEVFAIDPPLMSRIRSSRSAAKAAKQPKECEFQLVPNDIERYLHISSETIEKPPKQQQQPTRQQQFSNNLIIPPSSNHTFGILISNNYNYLTGNEQLSMASRNSSAQSVTRFNNSIMHKKLAPLGQRPQPKLSSAHHHPDKPILSSSASATNARIPPLGSNIKFLVRNSTAARSLGTELDQRPVKFNMVKSATSSRYPLSPTKNIITLPSLAVLEQGSIVRAAGGSGTRKASFNTEIVGRSISAAVTQKNSPPKSTGTGNAPKLNVIHYH